MSRTRMTPWARIVLAFHRGTGVNLSLKDISRLGRDDAIRERGEADIWEAGYVLEHGRLKRIEEEKPDA